ncbi:MAG: D-glycerate dehydrogenase [Candidatus Dormibacteria bacterium]
MATVLCTLPLPEPAPAMLAASAEVRVLGHIPSPEELRDELARGVDVLCSQLRDRIDDAALAAGGDRLRAVCNYAVGYNNIDVAAATAHGVSVTNTPGVLNDATADCALGLILAAARRLCEGDAMVREGRFTGWEPDLLLGLELRGSLLGVVGIGRIGQALARRALALGMRLAYTDRAEAPIDEDLRPHLQRMELGDLLAQADVISLHVPLTEETHHLLGEAALRSMKRSAVLVNTSRGPVIDERALVRALREGWIAAAGLDVYEDEPRLAPGLAECRNAVLAPHLGSATVHTRRAMAELCARSVLAALEGEVPPNCVNPEAVRRRG